MDLRMGLAAIALGFAACGGDDAARNGTEPGPVASPSPVPGNKSLRYFGFAAINCDLDDPFDGTTKTDYSDEVASFSNANQVCPTGDEARDAARLRRAAAQYRPVFYIEPAFFEFGAAGPRAHPAQDAIWQQLRRSIAQSGVDPDDIIFYLVDEPYLRGLDVAQVDAAAQLIAADYPDSPIMMIQAYDAARGPIVPASVDIWGFNAYAVPDPGAEPLYTDFLDRAVAQFSPGQSLAIVGDGIHTRFHTDAGLAPTDMAQVARRYLELAQSRPQTSMLIVYSWPGGIDGPEERGVRNLPAEVAAAWEAIGRNIIAR